LTSEAATEFVSLRTSAAVVAKMSEALDEGFYFGAAIGSEVESDVDSDD
jgi:hypothetical protein